MSAARIHGIKPAGRRRVVVENAAQPPVPDDASATWCGNWAMPYPAIAALTALHFIGGEASGHRDRFLSARPVQHPVSAAGGLARDDAVMASEVRRRYRHAAAREIVRAGAQDPMRGAELAGDQCRVRKDPGAESEVDPVLDQIERVVGQANSTLVFG